MPLRMAIKAHRLLYHSTLGLLSGGGHGVARVGDTGARARPRGAGASGPSLALWTHSAPLPPPRREREFFIDNLLVRIHFIIVIK